MKIKLQIFAAFACLLCVGAHGQSEGEQYNQCWRGGMMHEIVAARFRDLGVGAADALKELTAIGVEIHKTQPKFPNFEYEKIVSNVYNYPGMNSKQLNSAYFTACFNDYIRKKALGQ